MKGIDLMPTSRLRVRGGEDELVTAELLDEAPGTYTWWSVVVILDEARWHCVRRISSSEATSIDQL